MDADTLVLENIDHLFDCGKAMCAVMGVNIKPFIECALELADLFLFSPLSYILLFSHWKAAYRHMWNFNVGVCTGSVSEKLSSFPLPSFLTVLCCSIYKVLVVQPSREMLNDMLANALRVGTNSNRGEAAFLNK